MTRTTIPSRPSPSRVRPGLRAAPALIVTILMAAAGLVAQPGAPSSGGATAEPAAAEGGDLLGRDFMLLAIEIDVTLVDNEMSELEARFDVFLETDDLFVTGDRLVYRGASGLLTVWRGHDKQVEVRREGVITHCNQFIYDTTTQEAQFIGEPEVEIARDGRTTFLAGDDVRIQQEGEEGADNSRTVIRLTGGAGIGSRPPSAVRTPGPNDPPKKVEPTPTPGPRPVHTPEPARTPMPRRP